MHERDREALHRRVQRGAPRGVGAGEPSRTAHNWDAQKQADYDTARAAYEQRQRDAACRRRDEAGSQGAV